MNRDEFIARFPRASEDTILANTTPVATVRPPAAPEPQRSIQTPLALTEEVKRHHPKKCLVSIESRRVRLQDPDNGVAKWHIDALRYAGIISNDTTKEINLFTFQTKVGTHAEEVTVITLSDVPEILKEEKRG